MIMSLTPLVGVLTANTLPLEPLECLKSVIKLDGLTLSARLKVDQLRN